MTVEILEERLRDRGHSLKRGDTVLVTDRIGAIWCSHGWARAVHGEVPTGARAIDSAELDVRSAVASLSARFPHMR